MPSHHGEENIAIARRWHEEVINRRNPTALADVLAPEVIHHAAGGYPDVMSAAGVEDIMGGFLTAFSEL